MAIEREPPKGIPAHNQPLASTKGIATPQFGSPSPLKSKLSTVNVTKPSDFPFIKPKEHRPEHHRPPPQQGAQQSRHPHLHQAKELVKSLVGRSNNDSEEPQEIPMPAGPIYHTSFPASQPTFSTFAGTGHSNFTSVNKGGQPSNFIDLTRNDRFGSSDLETYVDAAKATANIKALLEGAFEGEEGNRQTRSRKKKQDALADKLNGLALGKGDGKEQGEEEEISDGTVEGLRVKLLPHQVEGVDWMIDREVGGPKKGGVLPKGGILADDMGLGKTLQSLAVLLENPRPPTSSNEATTRKISSKTEKSTLVVAPLALIKQWEAEIKDKVAESHHLKVCVHHGPQRTKSFQELKKYDVVITTYQVLVSEHGNSAKDPSGPQFGCFGLQWYRVILDEAHTIKNRNAKAAQACYALRAEYRWCLTGTPMQNNLDELQSLIRFLRIKPFDDFATWRERITTPMKNGRGNTAMTRLQVFLKACMKRRTKEILKKEGALNPGGKPSVEEGTGKSDFRITERKIEKVVATFSPSERAYYDRLAERADRSMEDMLKTQEKVSYTSALVLLLRLRQACNHPKLVTGKLANDQDALATVVGTQTPKKSKATTDDIDDVADMLGGLSVETKKCEACMITLSREEIADGAIRCTVCEDNFADFERSTQGKSQKRKDEVERSSHKEALRQARKERHKRLIVDSEDEDDGEWIVPENHRTSPHLGRAGGSEDENAEGGGDSIVSSCTDTSDESDVKVLGSSTARAKDVIVVGSSDDESSSTSESDDGVEEELEASLDDVEETTLSSMAISTKIRHLLSILHKESGTNKFIVFSQFTSMLDLVEPFLKRDGLLYTRYDGKMRNDEREASLQRLRTNQKTRILLCSLKCGSLGLNLTAASRVIILEPFWNPFVEEQAIDRVHRLNQTVDVVVYKITIQDTVEERILDLQEKKRQLANSAIEGGKKNINKLGLQELMALFHRVDPRDDEGEVDSYMPKTNILSSRGSKPSNTSSSSAVQYERFVQRNPIRKPQSQEDPTYGRRW